jgi:hypothetical protein
MKKIGINILTLALVLLLWYSYAFAGEKARMLVFVSPSCQDCARAEEKILPVIEKEFAEKVAFEYRDLTNAENYKLLLGLRAKYNKDLPMVLPIFALNGRIMNGAGDLAASLRKFIPEALKNSAVDGEIKTDLYGYFKDFRLAAIAGAGLIDGINPCAFTVIVFFMSFLAIQGYHRRELIPIGLAFIFAVFCTYMFIGLGIFNFLYRLKVFWLTTKVINITIGVFSIILGVLAVVDAFIFKRSGETGNLFLQLPAPVKAQIHKVIGLHYRRGEGGQGPGTPIFKLIVSAFVTGFLVSLLEAVCTGQLYLPTITYMLKNSSYKLQAFGYLLFYNLLFIAPLIGVFILAIAGTTSAQFSLFMKKRMIAIKILLAGMFILLGALLIFRF